jgi:hypothetical protein
MSSPGPEPPADTTHTDVARHDNPIQGADAVREQIVICLAIMGWQRQESQETSAPTVILACRGPQQRGSGCCLRLGTAGLLKQQPSPEGGQHDCFYLSSPAWSASHLVHLTVICGGFAGPQQWPAPTQGLDRSAILFPEGRPPSRALRQRLIPTSVSGAPNLRVPVLRPLEHLPQHAACLWLSAVVLVGHQVPRELPPPADNRCIEMVQRQSDTAVSLMPPCGNSEVTPGEVPVSVSSAPELHRRGSRSR